MVGPDYRPPEPDVPARWSEAPGQAEPSPGPSRWWETFRDVQLDSLVDRAVAANLDVKLAEARVREARANRTIAAAPLFPWIDSSASYSRSQQSVNSFQSPRFADVGGLAKPTSLYQAGFDASWEIDVFGGTRRGMEAAAAELEAQLLERGNVLLTLIAEVARNYVELRGAQRQLEVARQNLAFQRDTLELTRARFQGGLASELDVARAAAQVETTAAEIPLVERNYKAGVHRLSVLLAEAPGSLSDELTATRPIPEAPPALPPGLPSDLLRQRPDVGQAERQLAAATARVGVATADLFPKFSITGAAGLESISASDWFTGASKAWSFGPTISWPIFRGGQIVATIEVRNAQEEQALLFYGQTVLTALEDVENAIVAYTRERMRRASLSEAVVANQRAVDLAQQLYVRGLTDFLDVLDAQGNLLRSQTALTISDTSVSSSLIALYKALGGGWELFPPPADERSTVAALLPGS
ncbi:MAG: efflux transporter outer membrane subunit [bacterium]|nr:efflux transporter outer membrane subunit [bacterium]